MVLFQLVIAPTSPGSHRRMARRRSDVVGCERSRVTFIVQSFGTGRPDLRALVGIRFNCET